MTTKRSHSSQGRRLCTVQMQSVFIGQPSCRLQELELPEDMNLDDDGKAEEEEGGEDQPDEKESEPQDTENPAIDQDTNMEDLLYGSDAQ